MAKEILSVLETLEADEINYYFEQGTWRKFAACLGVKTDSFFPSEGADQDPLHSICVSCAAQSDCLTYAVLANEDHGFWGNTSERGRRGIRRRLRKTRPDLLRVGSQLAKRNRKGMKGNIAKTFSGVNDEVEPIDKGELMEHLLPKVRELLRRLAKHQGAVNAEQFLLSINISPEAFAQRLNLARQMKWVSTDGETIKLTPSGKKLLFDSGTPVAIRIQQKQPTTPQEVFMASKEYEWLSDLDIEILQCLAAGEIEDGANASGILAEKIGAETGSSFSNRLKRLDDEGLIRRRVNGKRTNYLAITGDGSKALHQHGVSVSPSSNGSKPADATSSVPTSEEVEEWSSETEESLLEQLESTRQMLDTVHSVLAENARLRERFTDTITERDEARAAQASIAEELDELKEELERLRPLADRYTQMQQLMSAPAE